MWTPKWLHLHKQQQLDLPVEYTTHIIAYELTHEQDNIKVVVTVHLPSKRVSEKRYDAAGVLKHYIHSSPHTDAHIKYLCSVDDKLATKMKTSEAMRKDYVNKVNSRTRMCNSLKMLLECMLISIAIWLVVWGIYYHS